MSERKQESPLGWSATSLSEVAKINPPLDRCPIDEDTEVCFVPMRAVATEGGGLIAPERRRYHEVKKGYTAFLSGDVIMAKITPCTENGKTTVVPDVPGQICFGSTEFHTIRPEQGVEPNWIERFLLQHETRRNAQRAMAGGVGQMRVPAEFLKNLTIPVAPTREQSRIAEALDELFSDLDAGVAALERARERLKLYRASVLKAAVEGALTADWRRRNPQAEPGTELLKRILVERRRRWEQDQVSKFREKGKTPPKNWRARYKEPVTPDTADLPALPEGWCWATVDQLLAEPLTNGRSVPGAPAGFPVLRLTSLRKGLVVQEEYKVGAWTADEAERFLILEGDFLVSRGNGSIKLVGTGGLVGEVVRPVAYPDTMIRFRFCQGVQTQFVSQVWNSRTVRQQLEQKAKTTAGIYKVNQSDLAACLLPLPPVGEQCAMVRIVENQLSTIERLESDIDAKLETAQALRQAILKHAFSGKLVPQDPKDEPAAELLVRIAAEREAREEKAASAGRSARAGGRRRRRSRTSKHEKPQPWN